MLHTRLNSQSMNRVVVVVILFVSSSSYLLVARAGPPYIQNGPFVWFDDGFSTGLPYQGAVVQMCGDGSMLVSAAGQLNKAVTSKIAVFNCTRGLNCTLGYPVFTAPTIDGSAGTEILAVRLTDPPCHTMLMAVSGGAAIFDLINGNWINTFQTDLFNSDSNNGADICRDRSAFALTYQGTIPNEIRVFTSVSGTMNWVLNSTLVGSGYNPNAAQGNDLVFAKDSPCSLLFWIGVDIVSHAYPNGTASIWMANKPDAATPWTQYGEIFTFPAWPVAGNAGVVDTNGDGTLVAVGIDYDVYNDPAGNYGSGVGYLHILTRSGSILSVANKIGPPFGALGSPGFFGQISGCRHRVVW